VTGHRPLGDLAGPIGVLVAPPHCATPMQRKWISSELGPFRGPEGADIDRG
jgi:hypothetical protein